MRKINIYSLIILFIRSLEEIILLIINNSLVILISNKLLYKSEIHLLDNNSLSFNQKTSIKGIFWTECVCRQATY